MYKSKVCSSCKENKESDCFYRRSDRKSGLSSSCKICHGKQTEDFFKTKVGLLTRIYNTQIRNSRIRKHNPPKYSKQEFISEYVDTYLLAKLYDKWVDSGYDIKHIPSFDRLDNSKGYSFDNIQLVEFQTNIRNANNDKSSGILNHGLRKSKPIIGVCIETNESTRFNSATRAAKELNLHQSGIYACLIGKQKTSGGYKWIYEQHNNI